MSSDWYYRRGSNETGPFTFDELKFLLAHGKLLPDDSVRQGRSGGWSTVAEVLSPPPPTSPKRVAVEPEPVEQEPASLLDDITVADI